MRNATSISACVAIAATAIALAFAGAATSASGALKRSGAAPPTRTVEVADDYFAPKRLKVPSGTRITWVWSSRNKSSHTLYLNDRPKGVKPFETPPMTAPFSFTRKLRKPGKYTVLCTLHEGMQMRIDVRR